MNYIVNNMPWFGVSLAVQIVVEEEDDVEEKEEEEFSVMDLSIKASLWFMIRKKNVLRSILKWKVS